MRFAKLVLTPSVILVGCFFILCYRSTAPSPTPPIASPFLCVPPDRHCSRADAAR